LRRELFFSGTPAVVQNELDMSEAQRQLQHAKEQLGFAARYAAPTDDGLGIPEFLRRI
jgi:hypothetical protein